MRRALYRLHLFIINGLHLHRYILSVRLHDLDLVSHAELIALRDLRQPGAGLMCLIRSPHSPARHRLILHIFHNPQVYVFIHIGIVIVDLRLFVRLAEIKSGGELSVSTLGDLRLVPLHILPVFFFALPKIIDRLPVSPRHRRHIQRRLHAPLDL